MPSMDRRGDAFDNAVAKSFFAMLETELLDRHTLRTRDQARLALFHWIEGFYNTRCRHSTRRCSILVVEPAWCYGRCEEVPATPGDWRPRGVEKESAGRHRGAKHFGLVRIGHDATHEMKAAGGLRLGRMESDAGGRRLKSYSSERRGLLATVREAWNLYRIHSRGMEERIGRSLEELRGVEALVHERYGLRLEGQRILDVGSGQQLIQLAYFSLRNDAAGIDLDVIVRGMNPLAYLRMLRCNGGRRTGKTIARKLLRLDARYSAEVARQLGIRRFPRLKVLQMDVQQLRWPEDSLDFVYCSSVFHCLPDPRAAIDEIARVLAPEGVAYISLMPFTGHMGSLDPRLFSDDGSALPMWAHLRPNLQDRVFGNAYVNRLRLDEWRSLFGSGMPGAEIMLDQPHRKLLKPEVRRLQVTQELREYTLDELVTHALTALWQKPAMSSTMSSV